MTCEICGKRSFSNRCMAHKVRKPLNQIGKQGRKWISTKQRWLEQNKQPYSTGDSLLMLIRNQIQAHTNAEIAKAKLEAFDVAFDCHDYDRLREYRAKLLKEVK